MDELRVTVRPLKNDSAKPSEPERDLRNDDFSAKPEAAPSEVLMALARPLVSEPVRPNEPDRDL